ncbi:hypothetical protein PsYK624_041180 [Phanerochaete sordida]|uniref:Uncharacterized protein n=1 Tax=Phanerochaete sordida TaxID=48140 RepID=A0A9P3G5P8_9APHY|nr:hypothetical protein PsYK624_041180 [Phanerochaete sordida]
MTLSHSDSVGLSAPRFPGASHLACRLNLTSSTFGSTYSDSSKKVRAKRSLERLDRIAVHDVQ